MRSRAEWSRYRDNTARHLIGISHDLQTRVMRCLGEDLGYAGLRPSFGPFLSLIWEEGRSLTAVAAELAISKQACGQLADLAEAAGYLERRPNPEDRRSKVVVLTEDGRALARDGVEMILSSESEYAALVGAGAYRQFVASLAAIFNALDLRAFSMTDEPAMLVRASRSAGVLPLIAVRIQQQLMEATIARGHAGLKMSHGQVLTHIGPEGGRIHEIARLLQVSRQAISATSRDLEELGYLRRQPDPRDRRGVVLELTSRGSALIRDSIAALDEVEDRFREILGSKRLAHLKRVARALYQALHLEEEIFGALSPEGVGTARDGRDRKQEIEQLASRLRDQLGSGDAARLASLLEPTRSTT